MTIALYQHTMPGWASRRSLSQTVLRTGDLLATVLRPVLVAVAILVAAMWWSTPRAAADPTGSVLNDVGIGNDGPISSAIAQVGEMFCPLIAKAGSNFASGSYTANGNGLGGAVAGGVTNLVIENQCPSWIRDISNGHVPGVLTGATNAINPLQSVTGGATNPLDAISGSVGSNPLQTLTGGPATSSPLQAITGGAGTSSPLQAIPGMAAPSPVAGNTLTQMAGGLG